MQDRIKEHDRDIRLARTKTSAVSEHAHNTGHQPLWNEVKFIDRDPHWYTRRVKEAIHVRLHSNNINGDRGIKIPEVWKPTINNTTTGRPYDSGPPREQLTNIEDLNAPDRVMEKPTNSRASCFIRRPETTRPYCLMKTSSMQSKRRDLHHKWPHSKTTIILYYYYYYYYYYYCTLLQLTSTTFFTKVLSDAWN